MSLFAPRQSLLSVPPNRVAAEVECALERSLASWSRSELRALYRAARRFNALTEMSRVCAAVATKTRYEVRCVLMQLRALDHAENPKRLALRERGEGPAERGEDEAEVEEGGDEEGEEAEEKQREEEEDKGKGRRRGRKRRQEPQEEEEEAGPIPLYRLINRRVFYARCTTLLVKLSLG